MRFFSFLKTILIVSVACIFLFVIFNILLIKYLAFREKEPIDTTNYTSKIPSDYLKILNLKGNISEDLDIDKFHFIHTAESKFRSPIAYFVYDQRYFLQFYKIDTSFKLSLKNIINERYTNARVSIYTPYSMESTTPIEYRTKLTRPIKPKKIYLSFDGRRNNVLVKNDSVVDYYSEMRNFSIKYNPSGLYDIYGQTDDDEHSIKYLPLEVLFIKHANCLYLLTMSINKEGVEYKRGLLYNLVTNKK